MDIKKEINPADYEIGVMIARLIFIINVINYGKNIMCL